ncbi:MAG: hypothetical protein KDJ38_18050, partial [Gammaproteobacteria bacterium]|nr:hypothetical protein [Gammaproteobacteria bacterium]
IDAKLPGQCFATMLVIPAQHAGGKIGAIDRQEKNSRNGENSGAKSFKTVRNGSAPNKSATDDFSGLKDSLIKPDMIMSKETANRRTKPFYSSARRKRIS